MLCQGSVWKRSGSNWLGVGGRSLAECVTTLFSDHPIFPASFLVFTLFHSLSSLYMFIALSLQ